MKKLDTPVDVVEKYTPLRNPEQTSVPIFYDEFVAIITEDRYKAQQLLLQSLQKMKLWESGHKENPTCLICRHNKTLQGVMDRVDKIYRVDTLEQRKQEAYYKELHSF